MTNKVSVPIFEFNKDGSIKPNPLFHRSWDKLHSRCIEYPYAASHLGDSKRILDVGTSKSDISWINWLDNLPIEVFGTDFDEMEVPVKRLKFVQSDVRKLPFEDNFFDKIFAVSVIEHIGLEDSQVIKGIPVLSSNGDIEAIEELKRILKPGGELILTLPYSSKSFIFSNSTRVYSSEDLKKINQLLEPIQIQYYEYQYAKFDNLFVEYKSELKKIHQKFLSRLLKKKTKQKELENIELIKTNQPSEHIGIVTWRKIPIENVKSLHIGHCDGIVCGNWKK